MPGNIVGMKLGEIKQIALAVSDIEASVGFYQKSLGLKLLFRAEPKMAFFDIAGVRLMLSEAEDVKTGGPMLYFACEDIAATYQSLADARVNVIREPLMTHKTDEHELWLAFFDDPDGHTWALFEEKAL